MSNELESLNLLHIFMSYSSMAIMFTMYIPIYQIFRPPITILMLPATFTVLIYLYMNILALPALDFEYTQYGVEIINEESSGKVVKSDYKGDSTIITTTSDVFYLYDTVAIRNNTETKILTKKRDDDIRYYLCFNENNCHRIHS